MNHGLVYSSIPLYRGVMNILYKGGYRKRFSDILKYIPPETKSVTELCFGDTILAETLQSKGITWKGIDINKGFVQRAKKKGFNAECADLLKDKPASKADLTLMVASLYHFNENLSEILGFVASLSPRFLIVEPVQNLSHKKGALKYFSNKLTQINGKEVTFRYDSTQLEIELSRIATLKGYSLKKLGSLNVQEDAYLLEFNLPNE